MQPLCPCPHPSSVILVWSSKKSSNLTSTCLLLYLSLSVSLWIVCSLPLRGKCLCSKASLFLQCLPSCCFQLLSDMALKCSSFPPRIFVSSFLSPFEFEFFSCALQHLAFGFIQHFIYWIISLLLDFLKGCSVSLPPFLHCQAFFYASVYST